MGYVGLAIAFLLTPVMAKSANLQGAFEAAFGQSPPMMRNANLPNIGKTDLRLEPVLMLPVGGRRFALVVSESFDGGYASLGDIAVAYLDHGSTGWRPVKVWYEFARSGSFGEPFAQHKVWSFNFGGTPFFAGEGELCGMGGCTRWYDLIGFTPDRPTDWGWINASGVFDPKIIGSDGSLPDSGGMIGCGGYEYSSVISPPRNKGDLMHVTYTGWMIPGGAGQKRNNFQISTELSLTRGKMNFRPDVKLPNCGS